MAVCLKGSADGKSERINVQICTKWEELNMTNVCRMHFGFHGIAVSAQEMLLFGNSRVVVRYDVRTNKSTDDSAMINSNEFFCSISPKIISDSVFAVDNKGHIYSY